MGKYSNRYKASSIRNQYKTGFVPCVDDDWDDIPALAPDKKPSTRYVDCHKKAHRPWKSITKDAHQWYHIPHFDLYSEFEHDECGFYMTDEQIEQYHYLFSHYDHRLFVA